MKAGERYFMAMVDLLTVQNRLERIIKSVEEEKHVPSMDMMAACVQDLMSAMAKTHRDRLSDERYRLNPGCENKCGYEATHHICGRAECTQPK